LTAASEIHAEEIMSNGWSTILALDNEMDARITAAIEYAFEESDPDKGESDLAIFVEKGTHRFFFSPSARGFGRILGAEPCAEPTRGNLLLLAGSYAERG
jgi:hypothetical protein